MNNDLAYLLRFDPHTRSLRLSDSFLTRGEIFRILLQSFWARARTQAAVRCNFCYSTYLTHGGYNIYFIDTHDRRCAKLLSTLTSYER